MSDPSANQVQVTIQKVYLKDASFETPMGVKAFQQAWKPKLNQQLQTRSTKIDEKHCEVVLTVTLTAVLDIITKDASSKEETVFIVEVHQAGIFQITAPNEEVEKQIMGTACPTILFPYTREAMDNLIVKGGFPPIAMPPINFDALYQQALLQQASSQQQNQPAH